MKLRRNIPGLGSRPRPHYGLDLAAATLEDQRARHNWRKDNPEVIHTETRLLLLKPEHEPPKNETTAKFTTERPYLEKNKRYGLFSLR